MNKFILFCLFFFLVSNAYNGQNVSSKKNNGKLQGVISYQEAVNLIRTSQKDSFVFALFHSEFCKYCKMVISFLEKHPNIAYIQEEEWINNKEIVLNASSPIVILSKNIHRGSKDKVTPFFDELNKRTKKVQVPALQIGNRILFESKDIMKFLSYIMDYLGLEKVGTQKNHGKKMNGNFLNMGSKMNSNKKYREKEEEEEEEEEEYENEDMGLPNGGNCGFNMNINEDLLVKLLQNKEVLNYLNTLALSLLGQQGQMGCPIPMGNAVAAAGEEFEESKKSVKKNIKKDSKKNGKNHEEANLRKTATT